MEQWNDVQIDNAVTSERVGLLCQQQNDWQLCDHVSKSKRNGRAMGIRNPQQPNTPHLFSTGKRSHEKCRHTQLVVEVMDTCDSVQATAKRSLDRQAN
ncbi:hypothetical protein GHT06_017554 [Daphnia sinensis]|uniref:Uncharacterized protein n=1 Tax=Daphnia sinensis TaxID=1820382 RepID=A0AAD5L7S2_9CRUS|nr:hypothetical protein GHT06_017554 [Daphnia sinensis]